MADSKLSALTDVSVLASGDLTYVVDVSDTTDDPAGTSKKATMLEVSNFLGQSFPCNARLTLEQGVPISTTDQLTSKTNIYLTPYNGNTIALYNGTLWVIDTFSEITTPLGTLTSGKNYDVFVYDASGVVTVDSFVAWTSDIARATALSLQNGVWVKSGDATRRYIGTFRTVSTTTTVDSGGLAGTSNTGGQRYVYNHYNQVRRPMAVIDTTANWSYNTNTIRQARATSGNKVEYISGAPAGSTPTLLDCTVCAQVSINTSVSVAAKVGVGVDSTSSFTPTLGIGLRQEAYSTGITGLPVTGTYSGYPGLGYHYLSWNESGSDGTCTWGGNWGDTSQSGMIAWIAH